MNLTIDHLHYAVESRACQAQSHRNLDLSKPVPDRELGLHRAPTTPPLPTATPGRSGAGRRAATDRGGGAARPAHPAQSSPAERSEPTAAISGTPISLPVLQLRGKLHAAHCNPVANPFFRELTTRVPSTTYLVYAQFIPPPHAYVCLCPLPHQQLATHTPSLTLFTHSSPCIIIHAPLELFIPLYVYSFPNLYRLIEIEFFQQLTDKHVYIGRGINCV